MVELYRCALVRKSDGLVVNVCVWDSVSPWKLGPPYSTSEVRVIVCPDEVGPGWMYINGKWELPQPPDPPPELPPEGE